MTLEKFFSDAFGNIFESAGDATLVAPSRVMKWTESNSPVPVVGVLEGQVVVAP